MVFFKDLGKYRVWNVSRLRIVLSYFVVFGVAGEVLYLFVFILELVFRVL